MAFPNIARFISHTDNWQHPIWTVRLSSVVPILLLILALTIWTSGRNHLFCISLAAGQLIGSCILSLFQLKDVTLRNDPDASPVQQLGLNS